MARFKNKLLLVYLVMEYCGLNFECKKVGGGPEKISTNIFSYQITFVSLNSNTTGVTCGA